MAAHRPTSRTVCASAWVVLGVLLLSTQPAAGMFEDQAGTYDWYRPYVGSVVSAAFHKTKPRVYVSTQQGVTGALQLRDGSLAWRHKVSGGPGAATQSLLVDEPSVLVTLAGTKLHAWDQADGLKRWSKQLTGSASAGAVALAQVGQQIAVLAGGVLQVVDASTGAVAASAALLSNAAVQVQGALSTGTSTDSVTAYTWTPGQSELYVTTLSGAAELTAPAALSSTAAAGPAGFAVVTQDGSTLCTAGVGDAAALTCTPVSNLGVPASSTPVLVATSKGWGLASGAAGTPGAVLLTVSSEGGVVVAFKHPTASSLSQPVESGGQEYVGAIQVTPQGEVVVAVVAVASGHVAVTEGPIKGARTEQPAPGVAAPWVQSAYLGTYKKKDQSEGFRALLVWSDARVSFLQQGLTVWSRNEALGGVTSVMFSELPPAAAAAAANGQGADWKEQLKQLAAMQLLSVKVQFKLASSEEVAELGRLRAQASDKHLATRDARGFRQEILVATQSGVVAALHNSDGRIIWERPGPVGTTGAPQLLEWRRYHDLTHAPQVATVHSSPAGTHVAVVDTYTGRQLEGYDLPFAVHKWVPLGTAVDGEHAEQRVYLAVQEPTEGLGGPGPTVHLVPDTTTTRSYVASKYRSFYFFLESPHAAQPFADGEDARVAFRGYGFDGPAASALSTGNPATAAPVWSLAVPAPVLTWQAADPREPEHTSVKVLGDRSMKYRYLNPNTAVVVVGIPAGGPAARADDTQATILVFDTVTGAVRYQQAVPGARGPATALVTGNTVAVQLWDVGAARFSVTALDLFDATPRAFSVLDHLFNPNATQPQSSYAPPPLEVLSTSFFTRTPASSLTTTRTKAGITSRLVLIATLTDQVYALDTRFLDPRRPHRAKLTAEEQEERLIPYQDTLPLSPLGFASLNYKILGLRGVVAAPSQLESTSLLFAYGVDLQYTRLSPAKGFDSLDDDFSYGLLVVALVALFAGSTFMHWYTKASTLSAKWK